MTVHCALCGNLMAADQCEALHLCWPQRLHKQGALALRRLDDSIRAAREIGIRFHPTRGAMTLGQSKGGQPPDAVCEEEDAVLEDMARVIAEFHDNSRCALPIEPFRPADCTLIQTTGVGLHSSLSTATLCSASQDGTYAPCRPVTALLS